MFPAVKGGESGERRESGEGWGLVGRLEEGREYEFSVVAVVIVGDRSMQGAGSQPVRITTHGEGEGCERVCVRERVCEGEGLRERVCDWMLGGEGRD